MQVAQERKHEVVLLDHTKCYCTLGKGKQVIYQGNQPLPRFDAIIPRIGASVTFYGSAIIRQFETMGVFTTLGSIALTRSRDKLRSLQALIKAGVDIPTTAFAKHPRDVENIIGALGGPPLVIKVTEGTQGLGVVLAETHSAAQSMIEAFYGMKANIIIQKFVKEARGSDIRILVIGNKVVCGIKRQGIDGEFRSNIHRGGSAETVELTKQERSLAIRATQALHLQVAGVDILRSNDGPQVIEVNSSPGLEGIESTTGIDVTTNIIKYVEENACKRRKRKDRVGL